MGTRADFYVGKGKDAEWLGSIAWDGYDIPGYITAAKTEENYRKAVDVFLKKRDDATFPADGWPWPWNNSGTTDCSYWFFDGQTWDEHYRGDEHVYLPCRAKLDDKGEHDPEVVAAAEVIDFPDMSALKRVTYGNRSGVTILSVNR